MLPAKKKKKLVCFVEDCLKEKCSLKWFKSNKENEHSVQFNDCTNDITECLISFGVSKDCLPVCPNATEKWLIMNRSQIIIPDQAMICPKHRLKYDIGWKSPSSCQYPGHLLSNSKKIAKCRLISPEVNLQIQTLFSSAAKRVTVPIGSQWCNNCRLCRHNELLTKNEHITESYVCEICMEPHNREKDLNMEENTTRERQMVPSQAFVDADIISTAVLNDEIDECLSDESYY